MSQHPGACQPYFDKFVEKLLSDGMLLVSVRGLVDPGGLRRISYWSTSAKSLRVGTVGVVEHERATGIEPAFSVCEVRVLFHNQE